MSDPAIIIERREIVLQHIPGVGPPGTIENFSIDGAPPFNMLGSISGSLVVATGLHRFYMHRPGTIGHVDFGLGYAPLGQSAIFDVNLNGLTIFTTQANRPTIPSGQFASLHNVPDVVDFVDGDYFTVDCDQVGTTATGGAATFTIWYF